MDIRGLTVYQNSVVEENGTTYFLASTAEGEKLLGIKGDPGDFKGKRQDDALLCQLTTENAAALRSRLSWLRPVCLGLETSFGFGDRLGLATSGHAQAAQEFAGAPHGIAPIFAQQSVRENARTGRSPQQVLDDATWGVFQAGWHRPWGADADHLKTPDALDPFIAAGYTFYTIDPGDHVDNEAHTAPLSRLEAKVEALPWSALQTNQGDFRGRYMDRSFIVDGFTVTFDRKTLYQAAAKYGGAIAHTARMYRALIARMGGEPFELEVSVDETETPTSPEEHFFVASELGRLGVRWVSLAPRYVGSFEKGVDYGGPGSARTCTSEDLKAFEAEIARHAAIARALGPYKLSVHSGSDKFSIYPIIVEHTNGLVHVKTAGTSYLEALRTVAQVVPGFFREILTLARERYETDRVTYHVSARLDAVLPAEAMDSADLPGLLSQFDARQVLHVTFGSVLDQFGDRLLKTLEKHHEAYDEVLRPHFRRHLACFTRGRAPA